MPTFPHAVLLLLAPAALAQPPQAQSPQAQSPQAQARQPSQPQQPACAAAAPALTGTVHDPSTAIIPGAAVTLDDTTTATSAADGSFRLPCVAPGAHRLHITAESFSALDLTLTTSGHPAPVNAVLQPDVVQTTIDVAAEDANPAASTNTAGPSQTISGAQLASLADDPDDLQRELQQLASAAGGSAANTTISVDGFQEGSKLPPKSSIAYIKVNPDLYSAEYRQPPFQGGRVEVYTKPGQKTYHGALFTTNGSPWMNARDPFSPSKASLGKQRYGFELEGPIRKQGSDFALTLEHRSIDNAAVVNAITLDPSGNPVSLTANVATPQRLWEATARSSWQLGPKNTFIASYSAHVNHLQNVGVGGTSLAETGYDSEQYEHALRVTNVTTVSARLMHEARASLQWTGETDTPSSTAPQLQVAGAFTSGGSSLGPQRLRELRLEVDDDAILSLRHHLLKFGTQFFSFNENQQLTSNFNGQYIFGGGTAPVLDATNTPTSATTTISGLEQYRRALLGLPGGAATAFTNTAGTPSVQFTQIRNALYLQDDWTVHPRVKLSLGLRYYLQNDPVLLNGFTPRFGVVWSVDKKGNTTIHGHLGTFVTRFGTDDFSELLREDGVHRITSTVYNPTFNTPFLNATPIRSLRTLAPGFSQSSYSIENLGFTQSIPGGWNLSGDFFIARLWNMSRSNNINAPFASDPLGLRPGAPNLNVLQVQNSAQGGGNVQFMGLEQHKFKRVNFFFGAVRVDIRDDNNDSSFFTPQNPRSNAGEIARRSGQGLWQVFGNTTFHLPFKVDLLNDFNAQGLGTFNITTGFDNNGDGNFNDRPSFAAPGTPGAVATPFGLLSNTGGFAVLQRDKGVMPWTVYLDTNVQRVFALNNPKADHPQTITANIRSSNLLNHTNVTSVGSVLGSPLFNTPFGADPGRRVEGGLRYSF